MPSRHTFLDVYLSSTLTNSCNPGLSLPQLFVQPMEDKVFGSPVWKHSLFLWFHLLTLVPQKWHTWSESEAIIRLHIWMNKHSEYYRCPYSYTSHCMAQLRPQAASDKNTIRVYKWRSARSWCPKPQTDTKWLHYAWNSVHITISIGHLKIDISEARKLSKTLRRQFNL